MDQTKLLKKLDIYRDGGSISVSFMCDGVFSELFFEIDEGDQANCDDGPICRKYKTPRLKEFHSFQWVSKVGATIDDSLQSTLPVSWETARVILRELSPQADGFVSDYLDVFDEMVCVAESEGTGLPRNEIHDENK